MLKQSFYAHAPSPKARVFVICASRTRSANYGLAPPTHLNTASRCVVLIPQTQLEKHRDTGQSCGRGYSAAYNSSNSILSLLFHFHHYVNPHSGALTKLESNASPDGVPDFRG